MRLPALALTISLLLPIPWQAGTAACGPIPSLESASQSAAVVFVGTASEVSPTSDDVVFDIAWQWKGQPAPATVTVSVAAGDTVTTSAASRTFTNGRAYLVFTENGFAPFVIDACNPAPAYVADGSVIPPNLWDPLGNNSAFLPAKAEPAPEGRTPPTFTALGAAAILGVLGLLLLRSLWRWNKRRPERRETRRQYRMSRINREYLEAQERSEVGKRTFGDKALERQRRFFRKRRKRRTRAVHKAAKAASAAQEQAEVGAE